MRYAVQPGTLRMSNEESLMFFGKFFFAGLGLPFTAYLVIQVLAIKFLRDNFKRVVWIPLPLMMIVLVGSFVAFNNGSNMWPIWLIITSPIAIAYIGVVWFFQVSRSKRRTMANGVAGTKDQD
jgi:hypothetical protein